MHPDARRWSEMARWFAEKQGEGGDRWHQGVILPAMFDLIGNVTGQNVLDLACGNGNLGRVLARTGATVTGIDFAPEMIEIAQERERDEPLGITYHLTPAEQLTMFEDGSFDLVFSSMALMDIEDAEAAIQEVGRVLTPGGRFVASLLHPCFEIPGASGWQLEKMGREFTIYRKVTGYREHSQAAMQWRLDNGTLEETTSYHRPLGWYISAFRSAGMAVTSFVEPEPTPEFVATDNEGEWLTVIPLICVFETVRL